MSNREFLTYAALTVAVTASVLWWTARLDPGVPTSSDAHEYITLAENVRKHGIFGMGDPPKPSMYREPLFPLMLAGLFSLTDGPSVAGLLVMQWLLLLGIVILFYELLRKWPVVPERPAFIAAMLLALWQVFAQYSGLFLTEILQTFLLLAAVYVTLRARERRVVVWWLIAGTVWAALAMTRLTWLFLPFLIAIMLVKREQLRVVAVVCFLAMPVVAPLAWSARNAVYLGTFMPTVRGGAEAYIRAIKTEDSFEDRGAYARTMLFGLAFELRRDPAFDLAEVNGYGPYDRLRQERLEAGVSEGQIDLELADLAKDSIKRHPFRYAADGLIEIWKLYTPSLPSGPTTFTFVSAATRQVFWPYAAVLAGFRLWTLAKIVLIVWGSFVVWRRKDGAWIAVVTVGYLTAIHFFVDAIPRYAIPATAIVMFLAIAALAAIAKFGHTLRMDTTDKTRLEHEIAHGRLLAKTGQKNWMHGTWVGQDRVRRRARMFVEYTGMESGTEVLELGFGTGEYTKHFAATGAHITAIDISPDLAELAKLELGAAGKDVAFVVGNAETLEGLPDGGFDAVVGNGILHHLEVRAALASIYRKLKPSGRLAFVEPNMLNPQVALQKNVPWIKKMMEESPDETAYFRWQIAGELRKAGFRDIEVRPFDFMHPLLKTEASGRRFAPIALSLERIPLLREIAGALFIFGRK